MTKMKIVLILMTAALFEAGCAQTVLFDRGTGKPIAKFQGDMSGSDYSDGPTHWKVDQVSHSAATRAQGAAAANVIGATGAAVSGAVLAAGSSGLFPAAAAVAAPAVTSYLNRPAALQAK